MAVRLARATLLLDVGHLTARRQFTIPADDATASQGSKSEEPHQTHCRTLQHSEPKQTTYRRANGVSDDAARASQRCRRRIRTNTEHRCPPMMRAARQPLSADINGWIVFKELDAPRDRRDASGPPPVVVSAHLGAPFPHRRT